MRKEILDEVIACLPQGRMLFHYFKGQYAFHMLSYAAERWSSVSAVKQSPFRPLLNQPDVKSMLAQDGSGKLTPDLFKYAWKDTSQPFVLTIDRWGDSNKWHYQTTRMGCNLVLQLNFSEKHNRAYRHFVKPEGDYIFNAPRHPVMHRGRRALYRDTLAWARIDVDMGSNQALIEEIQSDWVRRVNFCAQRIRLGKTASRLNACRCEPDEFMVYVDTVFAPFFALWSEAMLMAAINFIYTELGISTIYYHTHETGPKIKQVYCGAPPRSLYSDLPRRFCFQVTNEDPEFVKNDRSFIRKRRTLKDVSWYRLVL